MPAKGSSFAAPARGTGFLGALAARPLAAVAAMFFSLGLGLGMWSGASATILLRVGVGASIYGVRSGRDEWMRSGRRSVYALAGILTPFFSSKLRDRVEDFGNLAAYVDRMMRQYYPDFAWARLREAAAAHGALEEHRIQGRVLLVPDR